MQRRDEAGVELAAIGALVSLDRKCVVDVGCGQGRLTAFAAARAASVYAFDPSPENVAVARASKSGTTPMAICPAIRSRRLFASDFVLNESPSTPRRAASSST
jgi:predicted RNA methylase